MDDRMEPKCEEEPINSKSSFDLTFKTKLKEINDKLSNIEKNINAESFHEILQKINELQEYLNDCKAFLPAYNMKKCSNEIKNLTKSYEQVHEKLLPKKKFTFGKCAMPVITPKVIPPDEIEPVNEFKVYKEDCGFTNRADENLKLTEEQTLSKDIALDVLSNCNILVCGAPSTIRASSLSNCKVFACASTSIFVENCKDTIFVCAAQQLRIHDTVASDFYIYVTSTAIIENCKQLRFAPLTLSSQQIKKSFETVNFDESKNNWKIVNDFDWLSSYESSPNWCIIPEEERHQPLEDIAI